MRRLLALGGAPSFDLAGPWTLAPTVALRRESFGALAYDYKTRHLSFLKTSTLVHIVQSLGELPSAYDALRVAGVADGEADAYAQALGRLASTGMIERRVST